MLTDQQKEALEYFHSCARNWNEKATVDSEVEVNVIKQRNDYVLDVIKNRVQVKHLLDVGCGTGDLVCEASKIGIRSTGVDFAEDMINICKEKSASERLNNCDFECQSIFEYDMGNGKFDVISGNGFIEYITYDQLNDFLELAYRALERNGSLVLSSRNRLFNAFTLNEFTINELKDGTINHLITESIALVQGHSFTEVVDLVPLEKLNSKNTHIDTGIGVSTRFQYTPAQLIKLLHTKGFETENLSPVHIHGVIPSFKDKYPIVHVDISNLLQNYALNNPLLIPFASTFMIHAKRR